MSFFCRFPVLFYLPSSPASSSLIYLGLELGFSSSEDGWMEDLSAARACSDRFPLASNRGFGSGKELWYQVLLGFLFDFTDFWVLWMFCSCSTNLSMKRSRGGGSCLTGAITMVLLPKPSVLDDILRIICLLIQWILKIVDFVLVI